MKEKISLYVVPLILAYVIMAMSLIVTDTATVANLLLLLSYLFCFQVLGGLLLSVAGSQQFLQPLSYTLTSLFFGGFVFSALLFLRLNIVALNAVLYLATLCILFFFRKKIVFGRGSTTFMLYLFVLAAVVFVIISPFDFFYQFSQTHPNTQALWPDSYYYTAICSSLRKGTIYDAAYETGSPVNYQILGFIIPAMLANLLKLSSHQALWGLAQPFYKFLAILISYDLVYFFVPEAGRSKKYLIAACAILFPVLFVPFDFHGFVNHQTQDILGSNIFANGFANYPGTITYPLSIFLSVFCLLLFCNIDWKNKQNVGGKLMFALVMPLIYLAKIPFFFPFAFIIVWMVTIRIIRGKESLANYLLYIIIALLFLFALNKICFTETIGYRMLFRNGAEGNVAYGFWKTMKHSVFVIISVVVGLAWAISVNWLGILAALKERNAKLINLLGGTIVAVVLMTILTSFIVLQIAHKNGLVNDVTFDVGQFSGSGRFLLTLVSAIGIISWLVSPAHSVVLKRIIWVFCGIWCITTFVVLCNRFDAYYSYNSIDKPTERYAWYMDNLNQLKTGKYNDGLIVVNPYGYCCGIMIAGSDYGHYWTASGRFQRNYNSSKRNEYRWDVFNNLIAQPDAKYLVQMKNEGVKYVIATPDDSVQFVQVAADFPTMIDKVAGTGWIYELK